MNPSVLNTRLLSAIPIGANRIATIVCANRFILVASPVEPDNDLIIKSFGGDKPGLRFYHRQDDSYIKILSPLQKNIMILSPLQENFIMNLSLPTGGFFFYPQR